MNLRDFSGVQQLHDWFDIDGLLHKRSGGVHKWGYPFIAGWFRVYFNGKYQSKMDDWGYQ